VPKNEKAYGLKHAADEDEGECCHVCIVFCSLFGVCAVNCLLLSFSFICLCMSRLWLKILHVRHHCSHYFLSSFSFLSPSFRRPSQARDHSEVIRSGGQPTGATFYSARCGDLPASVPKTNHKDNAYGLQGLRHAARAQTPPPGHT